MLRLALILALASAPALLADAAAGQTTLSADNTSYDYTTGETVLSGRAVLLDEGRVLTSDEIRFNRKTQVATATGHVVLTWLGERLLADALTLNRSTGVFTARNLRIGQFPYYIEGRTADGTRAQVVVHDAVVTYREPGSWQPTIHAKDLTYSPGHYLRLSSASLGIDEDRLIPFSRLGEDLGRESNLTNITVDAGYRSSLGAYADVANLFPVGSGFALGPDLGIYTAQGVMVGPAGSYDFASGEDTATGSFRSGYMHEYGPRDSFVDILGNPVPTDRAYAEWHHTQQITDDLSVAGELDWTSDSEVLRDFHSKEFVPVQEPDNFVEAVYTQPDYLASVFTRFQPDSFYPVQERLPELRFDLLPTAIGGGLYVRLDSGLVHLEENPPAAGTHLASDRFDTFVGISRPFSYKGIVDFTPVAGGRYTQYWDTVGADEPGGAGRALGELGFDADLKMNAVFDYKNPYWDIDGLRHLLTPTLSYRYIPDGDKSAAWIPEVDRSTFTNYLPIMELGDMRAIDQLQAENVVRAGLHNTLETRDPQYGSRTILTFDLDEDFRFQRAPGQTDFSDVHGELVATPAHWLELRLEDALSTSRLAQRAVDASVTVREGEVWMANFGVGYLSDSYGTFEVPGLGINPIVGVDTYHAEFRKRINEEYEAFVRGDYDARDHLFIDQYYGVVQRVSNTWLVQYAVVFSRGPNDGQGHFGLEVNVNVVRF
jgi:LPS-assembly protein